MNARVLCLSNLWLPFPGGAERLIFNLDRDLHQRGADVQVLTGYHAAMQFDGPPVIVRAVETGDEREQGALMIRSVVEDFEPEILLIQHLYAFEFEQELIATGIPLVHVVFHTRRIAEAALGVFISRYVRDQLDAQPQDLVITPPAFGDVVAATHGPAIGFIKPIEHKGIDMLYRIAKAMPRRQFVVLRGEWQEIEDIRPRPNITFMEPVVDMRDFYSQCRLLLVPSRSEDAGTVAQEATLNGLPCISSNVGGLVETNAGGILLDRDNTRAWVRAIASLDHRMRYTEIVDRQQEHLAAQDRDSSLALFAERIDALARNRRASSIPS